MALNAYLQLKGAKQGAIKGSVVQKGRENKILVIAVDHGISSPIGTGSGAATGKRVHQPLMITKELDKSSPPLYNAFISNENITEWELQFWTGALKPGAGAGKETQHYTIKLTNARISSIHFVMPNNKVAELSKLSEYEEVAFTYEKIEWIWTDGNISAIDTWMDATL
jgi:type VI secretion system secreted protein Hcp